MGKPSSSPGRASVGEAVDELVVGGVAVGEVVSPTMSRRSMSGVRGTRSAARPLSAAEVMSVRAPQSLTMYAASSAARCVLTMV